MKKNSSGKSLKISLSILDLVIVFFAFRYVYIALDEYFAVPNKDDLIEGFNDADKFIKYGYPEVKSLSTQLLTLLTSVLVFSVTFSEKIVNFNEASSFSRATLIFGWTMIILAIIADGIGLAFNAFALPYALSDTHTIEHEKTNSAEFYEPAFKSLIAIVLSGFFFIAGLISIVLTGILSHSRK